MLWIYQALSKNLAKPDNVRLKEKHMYIYSWTIFHILAMIGK